MKHELLSVTDIYKSFAQNKVLKGISLEVNKGEVLCLIGGNGAGKSTLMKIIMGMYAPDKGSIKMDGVTVRTFKPSYALEHGIYMVPQEPLLFPNMSVEDNIFIGFKEKTAILREKLKTVLDGVGWKLNLTAKAMDLSIAEQQLVEITRGLLREAKLLILDEPTSALTFDEVNALFSVMENLKKKEIGMVYITHRLPEVFRIGTDIAIMRDGLITMKAPVTEFNEQMLIQGLLPSDANSQKETKTKNQTTLPDYEKQKPVFELQDYSGYGFKNINMQVFAGEILGIAGVVGAGRTELASTIFGMEKVLSGKALLQGEDVTGLPTALVLKKGINYVPEDRKVNGLFGISSIAENMTSAILRRSRMGQVFLNKQEEQDVTQKYIDEFRIKVTGQDQLAAELSGGNQQKIVIGRSLSTLPKLLILDEPTRGIDAGARTDVYSIIYALKEAGVSIILISSDMEEVVELCDRAVVIYSGRLRKELKREEITAARLIAAAFGVNETEAKI